MKSVLSVIGLVTIFILLTLSYYGLFTKVKIAEKEIWRLQRGRTSNG